VFRIAVTPSPSPSPAVQGAWVAAISELTPPEASALAPVRIENRSGVAVRFRQRDAPRSHAAAAHNQVGPYAAASYLWDDPSLSPQLVLSVPGATGDLTDPPVLLLIDEGGAAGAGATATTWSRMAVVRYANRRKPPVLLRLRLRRGEPGGGGVGGGGSAGGGGGGVVFEGAAAAAAGRSVCCLIVEEVDAQGNPAAAAAAAASAEAEAAAAAGSWASASSASSASSALSASSAASASSHVVHPPPKSFVSPVATRIMAPLLPRRLRPIAAALAFAADRASAAVITASTSSSSAASPPLSIEVVVELPSVGLSLVSGGSGGGGGGGGGGSTELLYARMTGKAPGISSTTLSFGVSDHEVVHEYGSIDQTTERLDDQATKRPNAQMPK